jgi:AraC-like DNA-binding protein
MDDAFFDAYRTCEATSSELHGHSHFLMTLVTRGEGIQILNGEEIPFGTGDVFLLSPADFHKNVIEKGKNYDFFGVKFRFESLDSRLSAIFALDSLPIHQRLDQADFDKAVSLFCELTRREEESLPKTVSDVYKKTLVEQLVIMIMRNISAKNEKLKNPFAVRMLGYIYSHFCDDINVSDAAEYAGYTPNYFNTLFRHSFGVPFFEYLRAMRLEYAKNLVLSAEQSLTEVALESGFQSLAHFSRKFKKKYGVSPGQMRKNKKTDA